jgi:hypothetical protein
MDYISITNDTQIAKLFEDSGIGIIMVDLEILGKKERQKGLNTVISAHSYEDIGKIKEVLTKSKCLVRINPIHEGSAEEIEEVLKKSPDIIMLPMFKIVEEVRIFIDLVGNRAQKYLLLETPQALTRVDDIIALQGIDAVHIGLNDLSIGLGLDFLYEPLIGGLVEYLAQKLNSKNIKFGFGGVSRLEKGKLILSEHFRLGSSMVIINRDFRRYKETYEEIKSEVDLGGEILKINAYLKELEFASKEELEQNKLILGEEIKAQMSKVQNKN